MARPATRVFAYFALLILASLTSGGTTVSAPGFLARAQGAETFTDQAPLKVYSGIPSHIGIADANPTNGLTGYCVQVANEGHARIGADNGFTVSGGEILSSDFFNNGSTTTTDDVYCVVVEATPDVSTLPRPKMVVHWTYDDGGAVTIDLEITVVTVELRGIDGFVLGAASVCTRGWDDTFLTGFTSNDPPTAPNALDDVVVDDWATSPSNPPTRTGVLRDGVEQCVNLESPVALANISVTLKFWAVFNTGTAADDQLVEVTANNVVNITVPPRPELRHITAVSRQQDNSRIANPNVIGSRHTACVVPSVLQDTLLPENVVFTDLDGARSVNLVVFKNDGTEVGLPAGTSCFSWTSLSAGVTLVSAVFTESIFNPTNTTGAPRTGVVVWDTDGDGNDTPEAGPGGRLEKHWNAIDHTIISAGSYLDGEILEIELPIQFNVADGRFIASIQLNEWVLGARKGVPGQPGEPTDGVPVVITIVGECGYFGPGPAQPTVLEGVTEDGRIQFQVNILNDAGCSAGSIIRLTAQAAYPPGVVAPPVAIERLTIFLVFNPNETAPIVAWAGTTIALPYGFSGDNCPENQVVWSRSAGQPGAFIGAGSHADHATTTLIDCNTSMFYESEDPGEVDIVVQVVGLPFSKIHIPIFYIAFEDLTLTVNEGPISVSERGDLSAGVRGWFVGTNPSGRPRETKNGYTLPKDRWVLPDDWGRLKGPDDFRPAWPSNASMPAARVTFFHRNEATRNSFHTGVKSGSSGFFQSDGGDEFAFNVHPDSGVPSVLGRTDRPRILSELTDSDGEAIIDFYGDLNLTYEGCAVNVPTGNPHCKPGDVVGSAGYFAVVEYPEARNRGKRPPVVSNTGEVTFLWQGYKQVTWQDGAAPSIKYVVAHLKDRDGFCDAIGLHNTLGVQVAFEIDSADGIIRGAADEPFHISTLSRDFAVATTFDTVDNLGNKINVSITRTVIDEDECQAWIRINNSLGRPVNVLVTFSAPPAPVPAKLRITQLVCGPGGFAIITNTGTNPTSLAGFGLRSLGGDSINPEEHLDLIGQLAPGQSIRVEGSRGVGWIFGGNDTIFSEADYARLIWEEETVDFLACDGFAVHPPVPVLAPDPEGKIILDIIVPFTGTKGLTVKTGWNLVAVGVPGITIEQAAGANIGLVEAIYTYDAASETWLRYFPNSSGNTMDRLEGGRAYWVLTKAPFTLTVPH